MKMNNVDANCTNTIHIENIATEQSKEVIETTQQASVEMTQPPQGTIPISILMIEVLEFDVMVSNKNKAQCPTCVGFIQGKQYSFSSFVFTAF